MAAKKIRVHNQGKRDFTLPPAKKGGKNRLLPAGRAIEIEEKLALKMIDNYPRDLVEFDSLVSGEKKDLSKENSRLESENQALSEENEKIKQTIYIIEDKEVEGFKVVNTLLTDSQFNDSDLSGAKFKNVDLSNVLVEDADTEGMTINGHLLSDLESLVDENQTLKDKIAAMEKEPEATDTGKDPADDSKGGTKALAETAKDKKE